jgi:hypothetical protein
MQQITFKKSITWKYLLCLLLKILRDYEKKYTFSLPFYVIFKIILIQMNIFRKI